jgi:hypothetical protein
MIAISVLAGIAAGGMVWLVLTLLERREAPEETSEPLFEAKPDQGKSPASKQGK